MICQLAGVYPENPFCTPQYVEYLRREGRRPWLVAERRSGQIRWGALGAYARGRVCTSLHLVSLSTINSPEGLWKRLADASRRCGIHELHINSLASPVTEIPRLPFESRRQRRREFVVDLQSPNWMARLSANHRRNEKKARKLGIEVLETCETAAVDAHIALQGDSMARRSARGEAAPQSFSRKAIESFLITGAGTIFQARRDEQVLASIAVLRSQHGAYYQSAGASPAGMEHGASHALILQVCDRLRSAGIRRFSLGGVNQGNTGLERFKAGFGAVPVELDTATYFVGAAVRRKLVTMARGLRDHSRGYAASRLARKQNTALYSNALASGSKSDGLHDS
ncbi:MAG: hypothetical protein DCC67_17915 [Planctomycetota bacterium]|nr:MAG: hypothetical protein DCC67_17915 [Planctomycetota bacterium]